MPERFRIRTYMNGNLAKTLSLIELPPPPNIKIITLSQINPEGKIAEEFIELYNKCFQGRPEYSELTVQTIENLEKKGVFRRENILIARVDNKMIGFNILLIDEKRVEEKSCGFLGGVGVLPGWRNKGIGGYLFYISLKLLAQKGINCVYFSIEESNTAGIRLLEKFQFKLPPQQELLVI